LWTEVECGHTLSQSNTHGTVRNHLKQSYLKVAVNTPANSSFKTKHLLLTTTHPPLHAITGRVICETLNGWQYLAILTKMAYQK